jgi:hypothetical protein
VTVIAAFLSSALTGCVLSPHSRTVVAPSRTITFTGYFPPSAASGTKIRISVRDGNAWVPIGGLATINSSSGIWTVDVPVPDKYWKAPCNAASFKATSDNGAVSLQAFDQFCLDSLPAGADFDTQQICLQPSIILTRPVAGPVVYTPPGGQLTINGPDESELYRCVTTVNGDLTIDGGARPAQTKYYRGLIVALPSLVEVTGQLTITGNHAERISLPLLQQVGTAPGVTSGMKVTLNRFYAWDRVPQDSTVTPKQVYSLLDAPALTSVDGQLELHNAADSDISSSGQLHYPFGLDALTQVGSVLAVDEACPPSGIDGLAGLTTVPGDVTLEWREWELYGGLMSNLNHVGGNLLVASRNLVNGPVLPALQSVAGNVTFKGPQPTPCTAGTGKPCNFQNTHVLEQLQTVGGDLSFENCHTYGGATRFPALTTVSGTLRITGSNGHMDPTIGSTGATPLEVGGLDFHDSTLFNIPLHADVQLAAGGVAAIHDNSLLCQCTVEAFLTSHALPIDAGTCDNGSAAMCSACSVPSQCL